MGYSTHIKFFPNPSQLKLEQVIFQLGVLQDGVTEVGPAELRGFPQGASGEVFTVKEKTVSLHSVVIRGRL